MNSATPKYRTTIWRTSMSPAWYAYQIYRDVDPRKVLAGGECRQRKNAEKEAAARIRELERGMLA
jgi:hypothetical protein